MCVHVAESGKEETVICPCYPAATNGSRVIAERRKTSLRIEFKPSELWNSHSKQNGSPVYFTSPLNALTHSFAFMRHGADGCFFM